MKAGFEVSLCDARYSFAYMAYPAMGRKNVGLSPERSSVRLIPPEKPIEECS